MSRHACWAAPQKEGTFKPVLFGSEKRSPFKGGKLCLLFGTILVLAMGWTTPGHAQSCCSANPADPKAQPSWIFQPARFSHAPGSEQRVVQYQAPPAAVLPPDATYQESGYRHKRSGISVKGSFDYRHVVETWGAGESIRPYGEWLYPFRPGATPFGPWGNPQGPWTLPFDSWINPYGAWNRYGYPYGMVPTPYWPPAFAPPAVAP